MAVQLEGPLEAVDSLTGTDSRAAHQVGVCMVRMLVRMAGDCWPSKDTNGVAPPEDHEGGMASPEEGAGGQQYGADSPRNEGWTMSETEDVSQPVWRCGTIHKGNHRHNREALLNMAVNQ